MLLESLYYRFANVRFRVVSAIMVTAGMVAIFIASFFVFRQSDTLPELRPYTDKHIAESGPFSASVDVGLFIRDFSQFDIIKRQFEMDATVWFVFSPAEARLSSIEQFSFLNGTITHKSAPDIELIDDKLFVRYEVKAQFHSELNYRYFPYEAHRLAIILTNTYATPSEMMLRTQDSQLNVSPQLLLGNWRIDDWKTHYGYSRARFDASDIRKTRETPEVVFSLSVGNIGMKNTLVIFVPLLFALLLALFSLLIPYKFENSHENALMFSVASASVASILAYRFVIQGLMPRVGYMTTTDYVFVLCLFVCMTIFLVHVLFFLTLMQRSLRLRRGEDITHLEGDRLAMKVNVSAALLFFVISLLVLVLLFIILVM